MTDHDPTGAAHDLEILDQFTRQANPFADNPAHFERLSLDLIIRAAEIGTEHDVLDVACGPGLLTCAVARNARRVTGLDSVPAMLERAGVEKAKAGLVNVDFQIGDARDLPFVDDSFDRVLTRFSFHHLIEPAVVLRELARVCRRLGLVTVVDVAPAPEKLAAYDEVETLRDPSHVHAQAEPHLKSLFEQIGLQHIRVERFHMEMPLERQLAASFPKPGDADRIRALFRSDAETGTDRLGVAAHFRNDEIHYAIPCAAIVGRKI